METDKFFFKLCLLSYSIILSVLNYEDMELPWKQQAMNSIFLSNFLLNFIFLKCMKKRLSMSAALKIVFLTYFDTILLSDMRSIQKGNYIAYLIK